MLLNIVLVPLKALKNMFFMFRLRSLNILMIAYCRAMARFELPSGTRYRNLSQSIFVMGLTYFINILSSDMSDILVDSSAPRVNFLTKDSPMNVPVSICLLITHNNLLNVTPD